MGLRRREPRANALGWYEAGPWPEGKSVCSQARIGERGGPYMRMYILAICKRRANAPLSYLFENPGGRPKPPAGMIFLSQS